MPHFPRRLAVSLFLTLTLTLTLTAVADVRLWPFYYSKTDPSTQQHQLEVFWPLYSRTASAQCTAHRIISFQRDWPEQYPWQMYFLWPVSGMRLGNGHDTWLFPLLWSGSNGQGRAHNSVFPFWVYYRNNNYRTLNLAVLSHNSWSDRHHSHYLLPLWWAKWSHYNQTKTTSHGLFPLYSLYRRDTHYPDGSEQEDRRRRGNLTLAYWSGLSTHGSSHRHTQSSLGLFPLAHSSEQHNLNWNKKSDHDLMKTSRKALYLFPYWQSAHLRQQLPFPPAPGQDFTEMTGKIRQQGHFRHLFPLFYDRGHTTYSADSSLTDSRRTTWLFPYWHTYRTQITPTATDHAAAFPRGALDARTPGTVNLSPREPEAREKHVSRHAIPLLFSRRHTTWNNPDGTPPLVAADQSFYLFPYYRSTYHGPDTDSANNFFLLGGWGHSSRTRPAASKQYAYMIPFLYWKHQAQPAPPDNPSADWADQKLWIFPYWQQRGHTGNLEKRTDFLFPLYLRSYEAHAQDSTWWTVLAGAGEKQAPPYLKRASDPNAAKASADTDWTSQTRSNRFIFPLWNKSRTSTTRSWNVYPLFWHSHAIDRNNTTTTSTTYPLLLSGASQSTTDQGRESTRHTYLLGLGGWSRIQEDGPSGPRTTSLHQHLFPFWRHRRTMSSASTSMLLPPFSHQVQRHGSGLFPPETRTLAVPHAWLPVYKSESTTKNLKTTSRVNRLFPFYAHEARAEDDFSRLSVLWLLYQREQSRGETRAWGIGGGLSNFYEKDANGFVERSFLYRLYHREERSWFRELEIMPFYHSSRHEDNSGGWSVLGGLFGARQDGNIKTTRVFFVPFKSEAAAARPPDPADSARRHLQYALNYLQARRFDRAAIEFIFAEGSYETDDAVLEQAGDAFAQADADHFQEFFRRDLPASLAKVSDRAQRYRRADTARQLRQRAVELYRQAIANGANQDDLELKIALCLATHDRGGAQAILRERFQRTGDFHHGLDLLRMYRHHDGLPGEVIDELCQRYPDQPLAHYLQAMHGLRKKLVGSLSARDGLWQLRWRRDLPPEEREKLAAALAVGITTLEQVAARPPVDYPPTRPLPPRRQLPGVPYVDLPTETTDDGLPVPSAIRGLAAHELLEITTRQYQALREAPNPQPAQDAEKRLLLTRMMTHLHLLPDTDGDLLHTVCRQHRDYYRDPERLLNELLQVQALLPTPPAPTKIASRTTPTPLAAACADRITGLRRELSYLTRWNIQLVAGQPSALGIGPFATKDCGNGYVDLDFFLGCVDRCAVEATAVVVSDQPREAMLRLGFDHELTVELNGRIIFGPVRDHIARRDEHLVPVTLQAGPNHFKMLVKDDKLSFGFYARLTTPGGEPLFFPTRP